MQWNDLSINGLVKSMAHLQPFEQAYDIAGQKVSVRFEFGFHTFTDDKSDNVQLFHQGERRYFCPLRYHCSTQLRNYFERRFFSGAAVPHNSRKGGQRYFCLDLHDYAIFFSISKPSGTTNLLKLRVISAYEVESWGRTSLPRGKPFNVRYILQMRNEGKSV
nr:hypothetical protein [Pseudomonas sp. MWU16-30317]